MYALLVGATRILAGYERSDVTCRKASLSEQDLLRVASASARAGFRRTTPRIEKCALPSRRISSFLGGTIQGVGSSCSAMQSSMLASPQGQQVQYMYSLMSGHISKGGPEALEESFVRRLTKADGVSILIGAGKLFSC
jgi:hypothetical protein